VSENVVAKDATSHSQHLNLVEVLKFFGCFCCEVTKFTNTHEMPRLAWNRKTDFFIPPLRQT